ncbi:uncharacterized protein LOC131977742 [Centropristis striata]|uniref:uncharacterized protein LOC131977742 n=1 Tax=Centropristis striata TaxID=184440 RepID=UPI0027DFA5A3|nr:uncharacterized protein LOC131977742 [Centropristis striata]
MAEFRWIIMSSFVMLLFSFRVTEQKNTDTVSLLCSVTKGAWCRHKVKWLHEGNDVTDRETSQDRCSARATFTTSDFNQSKNDLKCEVTENESREVYLFPFSPPQSSGEKPGDEAATTTTKQTMKASTPTPPPTTRQSSSTRNTSVTTSEREETNNNDGRKQQQGWWRIIIYVLLGLAALIITVVAVNMWTRTKVLPEFIAQRELQVSSQCPRICHAGYTFRLVSLSLHVELQSSEEEKKCLFSSVVEEL